MVRRTIKWVATNPFLHLLLGMVVLASGCWEAWDTLGEDMAAGHLRAHHAVALLGLWHLLKALGEVVEGFDQLLEAVE